MKETLFKYTHEKGKPYGTGIGRWSLPGKDRPGKWMPPVTGELIPCKNGYHLCRFSDLLFWHGPALWLAEYRGERLDTATKIVVGQARLLRRVESWNSQTQHLLAADYVEHILPIFERQFPNDMRPRQTVDAIRRLVSGEATLDDKKIARRGAQLASHTCSSPSTEADAICSIALRAAWSASNILRKDNPCALSSAWLPAQAAMTVRFYVSLEVPRLFPEKTKEAVWKEEKEWQDRTLLKYLRLQE